MRETDTAGAAKAARATSSRRPVDEPGLSLLFRLMRYYGYSSRELAQVAKVSKTTILSIARGHPPRVDVALRIARVFRVTVEQLWGDGRLQ